MTGTTAEGRQAYAILSWANDNPPQRVAEASARIRALAVQTPPGPALREVQDVGTVITRLAGAVSPVALSSHSISVQVIDMAGWDPVKHPRGEHGKFVKSGLISDAVKAAAPDLAGRSRASITAHNTASAHARATLALDRQKRRLARTAVTSSAIARQRRGSAGPASDIGQISQNIRRQVAAPPVAARRHATQADLDALSDKLNEQINKAEKQSKELEADIKEEKRAELGVEIASVAAGAAFAFFASKMGLGGGGEAAGALALAPYLIKTAIEKIPEIVTALAKFQIVGKGHGRSWAAHPVKNPVLATAAGARAVKHVAAPAAKSASRKVKTISSQVKVAAIRRTLPPQPSGT